MRYKGALVDIIECMNETKIALANNESQESIQDKITELQEIHEFLLENKCI